MAEQNSDRYSGDPDVGSDDEVIDDDEEEKTPVIDNLGQEQSEMSNFTNMKCAIDDDATHFS